MEIAKEFYLDRLHQEWATVPATDTVPTIASEPQLQLFTEAVVRIRKKKGIPPLLISIGCGGAEEPNVIPHGRHLRLDPDAEYPDVLLPSEESMPRLRKDAPPEPPHTTEVARGQSKVSRDMQGGGVRRGFGSLLKAAPEALEAKVEQKKHWSYDYDYDTVVDVEDGGLPCVTPEEMEESALEGERRRSMAILSSILKGSGDTTKQERTVAAVSAAPVLVQGAAMDSLKQIFHREGGVWFGDDGTLNEAVLKGSVDSLFLEAERMGIDIRKPEEADAGNATMKFGFFEDPPVAVAPTVAASPAVSFSAAATVEVEEAPLLVPTLRAVIERAMRFKREK